MRRVALPLIPVVCGRLILLTNYTKKRKEAGKIGQPELELGKAGAIENGGK